MKLVLNFAGEDMYKGKIAPLSRYIEEFDLKVFRLLFDDDGNKKESIGKVAKLLNVKKNRVWITQKRFKPLLDSWCLTAKDLLTVDIQDINTIMCDRDKELFKDYKFYENKA